ncbi:MAG TPA: hypothetical protein DDY27_13965, partial [Hyphomonadaceae bacterium]|nr:hypothetical protein [Hyphomonadaceae bacterium]
HYLDLAEIGPQRAEARLSQSVMSPRRFLVDGRDVMDEAEWIDDGDRFRLLAPIRRNATNVVAEIGGRVISQSISPANAPENSGAGSFWARELITTLRATGASRADIVDASQEFSVVTDETSLLVLETIEDYVNNDINLPEDSFSKDEQERYTALLDAHIDRMEREQADRIENVVSYWERQVSWYEAKFDPEDDSSNGAEYEREVLYLDDMVPPPPPPPP